VKKLRSNMVFASAILGLLLLIELPFSTWVSPVHAQGGPTTLSNITVDGTSDLEGKTVFGYAGNYANTGTISINVGSLTAVAYTNDGPGCFSTNVYGEGDVVISGDTETSHFGGRICVPQEGDPQGRGIAVVLSTGYAHMWGDTGAVSVGDLSSNTGTLKATGVCAFAKDSENTGRSTLQLTADSGANGEVYMGALRQDEHGEDRPGSSLHIRGNGSVVFSLTPSTRKPEECNDAHTHRLGVPLPAPPAFN
jgi:hypothetical protein